MRAAGAVEEEDPNTVNGMERLLEVMSALRDPESGCPWDLEQDFSTIAPFTIEEAHEVAEAIARDDMDDLRDELGDLLFQVVFHAQMAAESGHFGFPDVVEAIVEKMVRRHPHVFGDARVADAEEQTRHWEALKAAERTRDAPHGPASALDEVGSGLPGLRRALKLQAAAARRGFDWADAAGVVDKIREEVAELEHALGGRGGACVSAEVGDLLFSCVNLARHVGVDPEMALKAGNQKFERRFRRLEALLRASGRRMEECAMPELDALWERAKSEGL